MSNRLTRKQKKAQQLEQLEEAESELRDGIMQVGTCLLRIRDRRLFEGANFASFDEYCGKRLKFSRRHTNRLIELQETYRSLKRKGVTNIPTTQAALKVVCDSPLKDQPAIVERANEIASTKRPTGVPSSIDVRQARREITKSPDKNRGRSQSASERPSKPEEKRNSAPDEPQSEQFTLDDNTVVCPCCSGNGRITLDVEIPSELRTREFIEAWARYVAYRIELKKKMKPSTQRAALAKCERAGAQASIDAIEESISNGWTGIFPEKAKETESHFARLAREGGF